MGWVWILISGKRCSGKDCVAEMIYDELHESLSTSFALALKRECADTHKLDFNRLLNDRTYKEENRMMLIEHGRNMRAQEQSYWVRKTYEYFNDINWPVIVSDHRFRNESGWLMEQPGVRVVSIRVTATDRTRAERGWSSNPSIDNDQSETDLDNSVSDYIIANNGSRADLLQSVQRVLLQISQYT